MSENFKDLPSLLNEFNLKKSYAAFKSQECAAAAELAHDSWLNLADTRKRMLIATLDQNNLAVCDVYHSDREDEVNTGVVPIQNMQIIYKNYIPQSLEELLGMVRDYGQKTEEVARHRFIYFNCNEHVLSRPNFEWSVEAVNGQPNFQSEVIRKDNKYITLLNSLDVTDKVVEEINLREYKEPVYQYFGLPPLPPRPQRIHN